MARLIALVLFCLLAAPVAQAGAWLRAKGTGFLATGTVLRDPTGVLDYESRLYGEFGATDRLTIGFDTNQRMMLSGHALVFARLPLGATGAKTRYVLELGVGAHHLIGEWAAMARVGLAMGRSFTSRMGSGWLSLDGAIEQRFGLPGPALKLDGAIGLETRWRINPMLRLETQQSKVAAFQWTFIPTLVFKSKKRHSWVLGIERGSASDAIGVQLAFWRKF